MLKFYEYFWYELFTYNCDVSDREKPKNRDIYRWETLHSKRVYLTKSKVEVPYWVHWTSDPGFEHLIITVSITNLIFMFSGYLRSYAGNAILIVYKRGERTDLQAPIHCFNKYLNTLESRVCVHDFFYVLIFYCLFDFKVRSDQYFMSKNLVLLWKGGGIQIYI